MSRLFQRLLQLLAGITGVVAAVRAWETLRWLRIVQETARPAQTFEDSQQRVAAIQALEADERFDPRGRTRLLHHDGRTQRVIVLLHGFTNSPRQFEAFAPRLHEAGYNVLIPRLPGHGLNDHSAESLIGLSASDLVATANEAVDIARGLGEHLTVFGFSQGGIMGGWLAHHRADIDRVIVVSAPLHMNAVDTRLLGVLPPVVRFLPNRFQWWDPKERERRTAPLHAYPRFPVHALAALIHLGNAVLAHAEHRAPLVDDLLIVGNPSDEAVDPTGLKLLAAQWRRHGATVQEHYVKEEWDLQHDIIDPANPAQQVERVYPVLESLIAPDAKSRTD